MWTKLRSLAGSLADGVQADTILIPLRSPVPQYKEGKGLSKKVQKHEKRDVGMAKRFSIKYGNKG